MNEQAAEAQAAAGLYAELFRRLVEILADSGVISSRDLSELADAAAEFQATEALPAAVAAHCDLVVEWLVAVQGPPKNSGEGDA